MSTLTSIVKGINEITPTIKNKYVSYDDLNELICNMESFLKIAIASKNSMLSDLHYGLDILFPAMDHLKLFLEETDLGAIALVSKTLYNLMIKQFTQVKTEVFILHHYISHPNYDYDVNVNFIVDGQQISVPIGVTSVAQKRLRILIGHTNHNKFCNKKCKKGLNDFSKNDLIKSFNKKKRIELYDTILCVFCEKPNFYYEEHSYCAYEYNNNTSNEKYPDFRKITKISKYNVIFNFINPGLEHVALQNLKTNMPTKMKYTCKGVYVEGKHDTCSKCGIFKHIHDIYVEKK